MSRTTRLLSRLILWWDENFLKHPWVILIVAVAVTGWTLDYTAKNLRVNTNTAEMLSIDLPFQQNRIRLERAFPQDVSTFLLLIEGKTPEETSDAVKQIGTMLRARKQDIKSVYIPDEGKFFERNGLLYLDLDELQDLSAALTNAQPFIGRLTADFSLNELLKILGEALKAKDEDIEIELDPLLAKLREAIVATMEGRSYRLSWQQLMLNQDEGLGITKRFIIVTPVLNFEELMPAQNSYDTITRAIAEVKESGLPDIRVQLTGEVMMEHEELSTIGHDMIFAGAGSMVLVFLTLWYAYRSVKLTIATIVALTMGLILSMGFAAAAIGHLNLISIAFAVLFIGMGDAYSSHFCLRYRELVLRGDSQQRALEHTLTSTGSSLILCTLTAAIGLYAFIPTHYEGVSELGLIAGTSMFIALGTTFTILPALIKIMPLKLPARAPSPKKITLLLSNWPLRHARGIRILTLLLGIAAAVLLTRIEIDFNPLNLRDPNTESVQAFKYLLQSQDTSPMTLTSLATSAEEAQQKAARFEALPTVDKVVTVFDFVPKEQDEKLALIEELSLILGPQLNQFPDRPEAPADLAALEDFQAALRARIGKGEDHELTSVDEVLTPFLDKLRGLDPGPRQDLLNRLQERILWYFPITMHNLQESLMAQPIRLESLPKDLVERWVSKDGQYRVQMYPKQDLNDLDNLRKFIEQAQKLDPNVTDLPVTYLESMNEVIRAFQQAFATALGAITLLLLIILRSVRDTLLVLLPLLLASLFTAAAMVLLKIPFNFANIIVLPLLFGLGVDNGIHMAHRLHYLRRGEENLLSTSEAKGVFFGALTTVFSFVSLAFTSHLGTASIGMLLAIGLMFSLLCSLIVLPAFGVWNIGLKRT